MVPIFLLKAECTYPWQTKLVMKKMPLLIIIIYDYPGWQPGL